MLRRIELYIFLSAHVLMPESSSELGLFNYLVVRVPLDVLSLDYSLQVVLMIWLIPLKYSRKKINPT